MYLFQLCSSRVTYKLIRYFAFHTEPVYFRALALHIGEDSGAVYGYVKALERAGFVSSEKTDARLYFTTNQAYPILPELRAICYAERRHVRP